MAIIATVHLRGSCPKKKPEPPVEGQVEKPWGTDAKVEDIGFNVPERSRIPSSVPKWKVLEWLKTRHAVQVEDKFLDKDQRAMDENFWDEVDTAAPEEIAPYYDPEKDDMPKPRSVDAKRNKAETDARKLQDEADAKKEAERLAGLEEESKQIAAKKASDKK